MRLLKRNQRTIYYALLDKEKVQYDEYGNEIGRGVGYTDPVPIKAHVSTPKGNVSVGSTGTSIEEYGITIHYQKTILIEDPDCPIDENSVLYVDKKPEKASDGTYPYDYIVTLVKRSSAHVVYMARKVKVS